MTENEMLHVRMKHGKGDPQKAANYLLSDKDHTGKLRSVAPEILDGDPNNVAKIANMTTRAHKYATGCLSFRDTEKPSLKQQLAIMKEFEATFLPGLEKDKNYSIAWVSHYDKGNLELNYFLATTELTTGKQLNPFPPGTLQHEFNDAWVQNTNHLLGYDQVIADPLKISRSKFEQKIIPLKEATSQICQQAKTHKEIRDNLEEVFKTAIENNEINNRQDIIDLLKEQGEVTRVGENYISFKPEGEQKSIRLKGSIFEEGADYNKLKEQSKEFQQSKNNELTQDQFNNNKEKIDRLKQTRLEFFKKQFQQKEKKVRKFGPKSMKAKPVSKKPVQQPKQPQSSDEQPDYVKINTEKRIQEEKSSLKKEEINVKNDHKKQELSKPIDPVIKPTTKDQPKHDQKPAISALAQLAQTAVGSRASFLTIQINQILSSKNALELQIGSLSMFKLSDIIKKQELLRQIYQLQQKIDILKAKQEQEATAELVQKQAAQYKNGSSFKPKWV